MQFLKRKLFSFFMAFGLFSVVAAQTPEQMQKAFRESYADELKGDYTSAIADIQKVYKADSYESNLRLGWLNYSAKKYPASMDYYQKAIDLKQYSVEARLGYVYPANASKEYDKAYSKYEEVLKLDPYNSAANYWVGYNYYVVKKYDIAAKYFELLVNMYPFDYDGNHMLGWTYLNLGKAGEAKLLFQKALLNKPDDASAKEGLSKCK
jgi:tetratricopeptide (TPR) repeat protein